MKQHLSLQLPNKFTVIRDSREKVGRWTFKKSEHCNGTIVKALKTGDYTLEGLEPYFVIERKKSTSEWSNNLGQERFYRELDRLTKFADPYILCEFTIDNIMEFPHNSGIPRRRWSSLHISPAFLLKKTLEIQVNYGIHIILAGSSAPYVALSLFKRIMEKYGK